MSLVAIDWNPDAKGLRSFGVSMLVGFGLIGLVVWWKVSLAAATGCWIFGAVAGVLGLTGTKAAMPIYKVWMGIAFVMGSIMGRILLGLFYYGMITPMGLVMRLQGRDKLQLKPRPTGESYWCDSPTTDDPARYKRQF
ncbi:MAG: SxtJ family membrane protein [Planctomycetota bacterium]|jgi:hypothetical protein